MNDLLKYISNLTPTQVDKLVEQLPRLRALLGEDNTTVKGLTQV